jgi:septal ring factor EnvC (AmiA/AmiB activator)
MKRSLWILAGALLAGSALGAPESTWNALPEAVPEQPTASAKDPKEEPNDEAQNLREEQQSLKKEAAQHHAFMIARGRAYVRLARAGLLPLSEGLDAFAAHAAQLERLRRALGRDLARAKQITARQIELSRALKAIEELPASERNASARARSAILAAEERDQAFQRAFQTSSPTAPTAAVYAARISTSERAPGRGGFGGQRGRLPFPLAGRSEIQTVRSPSGSGKALLLSAPWGAPVRAVYAGRVAFADDYPELGNTIILDHGGHFYTVSAHLQHIAVQVGEELDAGQRIGTVGAYDQKPGLLFEVRDGQSTLNTPEWFGL